MKDALTIEVFKELSVLNGDRTPDGRWTSDNPWVIERNLAKAIRMIDLAKSKAEEFQAGE